MRKIRSVKWILAISAVLVTILITAIVLVLREKSNVDKIKAGLLKAIIVSSMKSETHGNITYYYKSEQDFNEGMKFWYDEIVPESHTMAKEYFGDINARELDIVIFSDQKAKEVYASIENSDAWYGFDDNTMYVDNETINRYTFVHEYVHYITDVFCEENNISYSDIPRWFLEGIAEYTKLPEYYSMEGFTLEEFMDFKQTDIDKKYYKLVDEGHDLYYQSYLAIYKLIELKGEEAITRILLRSKDVDFYAAFEEEVQIPFEEFESLVMELLPSI